MAIVPMPLVPIIWSMIAGSCLAIAAVQLAAWIRARSHTTALAFGVLALSVAVEALFELALMQSDTAAQYARIQRWLQVPLFLTVVSMLVFVRAYFGAGRLWLAYTICALRVIGLTLNFVLEPNIEFTALAGITKIVLLGEEVSVPVGTRNPWAAVFAVSSYLLIIFVLDAAVALWKRGDRRSRRRAVITGGSLLAGLAVAVATATLIRVADAPVVYSYSIPFALLLVAIASEISSDISRAAELASRLQTSESALARTGRRMEQATLAAGIGIWEWDLEHDAIWMNDSGRAFFGYGAQEKVTFARFLEKLHDEDRDYVSAAVSRSRLDGGSFDREYRVRTAAGVRWIHTRGSVERDAAGRAVLMRGVFFDVSARREAANRFYMVVEAAANGLMILDAQGRITMSNASAEAIFGYTSEELAQRSLHDLLPQRLQSVEPRDPQPLPPLRGAVEIIGRRRDGTPVDVEVTMSALRDGAETLVSVVDLGERRRRDAQLRKERAFLRQVIDIDPNLIFAKDREGRFTLANLAVAELYGTTVEDLIGRTDADFDDNPAEVEAFRRADVAVMDMKRELFIPEESVTDAQGKVHLLQTVKRPIVGDDGVANQVLGVSTDITARKNAEVELDRQRNELAHLARVTMLSELSGSIAHDLNQPLAAILTNAEAARAYLDKDPPDLGEVRAILSDIVSDDMRAAQVISGMRSLMRKSEMNREPVDIGAAVQDVLKLMHSDFINAGVRVTCTLDPGLQPVTGDRVQLQQVVLNLLMNGCDAMAQNPPADRELVVIADTTQAGVRVRVSDAGPGMSLAETERAFEPFFTTKSHGLGLGLAICRSIIGAHGGSLHAVRNPSRGMTFVFTLPFHAPSNGTKRRLRGTAELR